MDLNDSIRKALARALPGVPGARPSMESCASTERSWSSRSSDGGDSDSWAATSAVRAAATATATAKPIFLPLFVSMRKQLGAANQGAPVKWSQ